MRRRIAVITSSRADYSHLYWPLRELQDRSSVDLRLIALGPHLSPEFGYTLGQIEQDGFAVEAGVECLLSSDSDMGMAKTIGVATLGLADLLGRLRPDLLLLIADRYEMLAPASVALALRIPIAHVEGGEISEGAIDDAVRNALTKLSHLHFTSTERARRRVVAMGEEPWRVHCAGAPSLDHLRRSRLLNKEELERRLNVELSHPTMMVAYHPVTLARDTTAEADDLFAALAEASESGRRIFFSHPNADAGSYRILEKIHALLARYEQHRSFTNLDPVTYWSLLAHMDVMLGNSSSGIMESASFALPAIDIGTRQRGRERGSNVITIEADRDAIRDAIAQAFLPAFRASLAGMKNPYGDGAASERIASVLASVELGGGLLRKVEVEGEG